MNETPNRCRICDALLPARPPIVCPACLLDASIEYQRPSPGAWEPASPETIDALIPGIEIADLIGRGGMGAVYLGAPADGDDPVAVKVLAPELANNPELRRRFRQEAQILAQLDHPGIVPLRSSGESGDLLYLVMDFIEGPTLDHCPPVKSEETMAMGIKLCEALAYAHDQGVVHRDLKPSNILLDAESGLPRIADFGLAKPLDGLRGETLLTSIDQTVGTPRFMAPEQLDGREADARTDMYALAAILYQRLTGSVPSGAFKRPSQAGNSPREYDKAIMRALSPDPAHRFRTASEFGAALRKAMDRRSKRGKRIAIYALLGFAILGVALWSPVRDAIFGYYGRKILAAQNAIMPVEVESDPAITTDRPSPHHYLGICVAANDSLVVAGAPCGSETLPVSGSGYALVYRPRGSADKGNFRLEKVSVLNSPAPSKGDRFGYAVAQDGGTIICGAWGARKLGGKVFVFESDSPDSWQVAQELEPPSEFDNGRYGFRLALHGNTLAVSSPGIGKTTGGRVFIYKRRGPGKPFAFKAMLRPENLALDSRFGRSIDLDGNSLVVGCYRYRDRSGARRGCVYVYERQGDGAFELAQQLVPEKSRAGDYYGSDVKVDGDWLVVSSWKSDLHARNAGAAVVYIRSFGRWRERQYLVAGKHAANDGNFADSLHLQDGKLFCGAPAALQSDGTTRKGQIFVYSDSGSYWQPQQIFERNEHVRFASSLSICRGMLVVSGIRYDNWRGGIWVFPIDSAR